MPNTNESIHQDFPTPAKIRIVGRDEFLKLLVSRLSLRREDDPRAKMYGLRDSQSGMRYLIPERQMDRPSV